MYYFELTHHNDDFIGGFHRVEMPDGPEVGERPLVPEFDGPIPPARHVRTDAWPLDVNHLHRAKKQQRTRAQLEAWPSGVRVFEVPS